MAEINEQQEGRIRELDKHVLFTQAPGSQNKNSRLVWGVLNGNPRISVFTNVPSDQQTRYGIITAAMDPNTFLGFLTQFERVARGQIEKFKVECRNSPRDKDGKQGEIRKVSDVFVGRNEQGIIWISVVDADEKRPKIVFEYRISRYHQFFKPDGSAFTEAEASQVVALASISALRQAYQNLTTQFRPASVPQSDKPAAQASQSYSKPAPAESFDDISF